MTSCCIILYPPLEAEDGEGKFLQCRWDGIEYLLFANRDSHRFHNQILARFLGDNAVAHRWLDDQTLEVESPKLEVIGGGRFRLDRQHASLELWDHSTAYGRFNEAGIEEKIRSAGNALQDIQVRIS